MLNESWADVALLLAELLPELPPSLESKIAALQRERGHEVVDENTARIPLGKGVYTLIDKVDLPLVLNHSWYSFDQRPRAGIYARAKIDGKTTPLHRFLLGVNDPKVIVDHIDRDTLNNRRLNLRITNRFGSAQNRKRGNTGYTGVCEIFNKSSGLVRYRAYIRGHNKRLYLGTYATAEEAAVVRDRKAIELHGEFAVLNFPGENK